MDTYLGAIHAARLAFEQNPSLLTDQPHPKISTMTARDYAEWLIDNATYQGVTRALHMIADALKLPGEVKSRAVQRSTAAEPAAANVIVVDFTRRGSADEEAHADRG
jgi:hypothetical protein